MLGAVLGDIVGSVYERNNVKTKDFPLRSSRTRWTNDTGDSERINDFMP